jgi:uncharacterized membrane protein SirB2
VLIVHVIVGVLLLAPGAYTLITKNPVGPLARNTMLILATLSLGSGFWNFFMRIQEGVPKAYHTWFGVKFLLALHILSIAVIAASPKISEEKRTRQLKFAAITGIGVIFLGIYLGAIAAAK